MRAASQFIAMPRNLFAEPFACAPRMLLFDQIPIAWPQQNADTIVAIEEAIFHATGLLLTGRVLFGHGVVSLVVAAASSAASLAQTNFFALRW